jgi:Na+-translocating ferredoxin:NAD+ oxidoreductase subunit G
LTLTFITDTLQLPMALMRLARMRPFLLLLVFSGLIVGLPAHAAQYWTKSGVLKEFFKTATKVTYKHVTLNDASAAAIAKQLGVASVRREWDVYTSDKQDGFAILDVEKGMHEPIDFAVRFNARGAVQRVEIVEYREAYGGEVRGKRFRDQFLGKTASDPIIAGRDIDIVSGASISSRSIALGVKRDTLVIQTALKAGSLP